MAKITTITNPLTGQPAQVDQLDHTAQQIDDAIARALPGGAIDSVLSSKPNPNLLDNWYFGNPVDQRGGYVVPPGVEYAGASSGTTTKYYTVKSTFTYNDIKYVVFDVDGSECNVPFYTCVRGYTGAGYGIDRWKLNAGYALTLEAKGIKFTRIGDNALALTQIVDNPSDLSGKTVTFSALIDDTTALASQRLTINANETTVSDVYFGAGNKLAFVTMTLPDELSDLQLRFLNYKKGSDVTYKAAKLELGDHQTLAHQENGVWVLNEVPDYGDQLARCQRVLIPVLPGVCYSGRIDNEGTAYIEIPTPVSMRSGDVPVIIGAKNGLVYHASGLKEVTYGVVSFGANSVTISASGLGITNQVCSGCFANKVFLSKEL